MAISKEIKVSASVLAADLGNLLAEARRAEEAGADFLHLDVMDGHFVPNLTFGAPVIASLRRGVSLPFDAHLMIEDPDRYLKDFTEAGCDYLLFHAETVKDPAATIRRIRSLGRKPGMVVNPETSEEILKPFARDLDYVLFMSVHPGFAGQKFIPEVVPKIRRFASWCAAEGLSPLLAVDGGISPETALAVVEAGANLLVAASALYQASDLAEAVRRLKSVGSSR